MKSNLNQEINYNDLLVKIIQNITEIDLNSIKQNKKRFFSYINYFDSKRNKNLKLFKKTSIDDKNLKKCFSPEYINNNINFDNKNSLNLNTEQTSNKINNYVSQSKRRRNFILKSEIYELNAKKEKTNENKNIINNNINFESEEDKIKNININKESDNLISNYYKNNIEDNIINQNEISTKNMMNEDNNDKNKFNFSINNNNINNNINNYFYNYTFPSMIPFMNYNNNNYIDNNNKINENDYINLSKTQTGCQILINKIISDTEFANEILFQKIKNNLKDICTNIFGSSMIKILFQNLSFQNMNLFLDSIKDCLINICQTEIGSRVMQSIIDIIKDNNILLNKLINYLNNNNLLIISKSSYGHYFIKYYLSKIHKKEFNNFIYIFIFNNFIELTQDKFGVCIVQRAFEESDKEDFDKLLKLTEQNFKLLINHNFGIYLFEYIFIKIKSISKFKEFFSLIKLIEENIIEYCTNKYSSILLEKLFEKGDETYNEHIINNLIKFHIDEIINIIIHQNGYYVIKKAMKLKDKKIKKQIIKSLKDNIYKLEPGSRNVSIVNSFCNEYAEYL